MSKKIWFTEVDDCIMAAYNHVKTTGRKVEPFHRKDTDGNQTILGLKSKDLLFVMTMISHLSSKKRNLAKLIHNSNISVIDVINRQLLPFL